MSYEYKILSAQVFSDQELDFSKIEITQQFVDAEIIDTTRFVVNSGILSAYSDVTGDYFHTEFKYE